MTSEAPPSKRDQLLDVAWRLFYRDGYNSVGIDTLLAESGIAKKTLYNHFESKDALIVALLDRQDAAIIQTLDERIAAAGETASAQFNAVFNWVSDWIHTADFRGCAFSRATAEFPDPKHPVHQAAWRFKEAIRERLIRIARMFSLRLPAATALADTAALLIEGAIMTAHGSGSSDSAEIVKASGRKLIRSYVAAE